MTQKEIQKPYPNYHAARVRSPGLFLRVRVMQTTKEGIMIYGGPLKTDPRGPTKTQAVRFPKDKFSVKQAKAWLKDHKQKYISFEPASEKKSKCLWPTITSVGKEQICEGPAVVQKVWVDDVETSFKEK